MNLFKESVSYNLSSILPDLGLKTVSGAAFSKARYKIDLSFFKDLNQILIDYHKDVPGKLWRGYRLIAGDGSTVGLPPSTQIKNYFGIYSEKGCNIKSCMAQLFMFYDVFSGAVLSKRISTMKISEKVLFSDCIKELPSQKSIVLLDRGFGYFHIFKQLCNSKQDFCIRISVAQSCFGKAIKARQEKDFNCLWTPSEKEKATCKKYGLDTENIKVRVTKIRLKSGETEILISSLLNISEVAAEHIKNLYELRWPIEEGYKKLKPKMKLEQFGSRKSEGIFQEFEAHIFMMNLIAILGIQAQQKIDESKTTKLRYKYNWQNAFRFVRKEIISILNNICTEYTVQELIKMIASTKVPIKENRSFERITFKKRKNRLHQTYK